MRGDGRRRRSSARAGPIGRPGRSERCGPRGGEIVVTPSPVAGLPRTLDRPAAAPAPVPMVSLGKPRSRNHRDRGRAVRRRQGRAAGQARLQASARLSPRRTGTTAPTRRLQHRRCAGVAGGAGSGGSAAPGAPSGRPRDGVEHERDAGGAAPPGGHQQPGRRRVEGAQDGDDQAGAGDRRRRSAPRVSGSTTASAASTSSSMSRPMASTAPVCVVSRI